MRPQRRRLLAIAGVAGVVVLALYAALRVGWALPHQRIETGVDDYSGVPKEYAQSAVDQARMQDEEWGEPGFLIAAYRVTEVRRCPGRPIRCGPAMRVRKGVFRENPACEGNPFRVDVRTYTLFGLSLGEADLPCDA